MKMCFGNSLGFKFAGNLTANEIFGYCYGGFLLEVAEDIADAAEIGEITADGKISYNGEEICLERLLEIYENKLESVYRCNKENPNTEMQTFSYTAENRVFSRSKNGKAQGFNSCFPGYQLRV